MPSMPVLIERYRPVARLLHWLTFIAVSAAIVLALIADNAPRASKGAFYFWHKSFGLLILALVLLRFVNRLIEKVPPLPGFVRPFEKKLAAATHYALYWLLLIVPVLGWAGSSAFGRTPSFFGLFTMPPLLGLDPKLGEAIMSVHVIAAFSLTALIGLHICAALYHGLQKDGILTRMVSGANTATPH